MTTKILDDKVKTHYLLLLEKISSKIPFKPELFQCYLIIADALLSNDRYKDEVLAKLDELLNNLSGTNNVALAFFLLQRGANPTAFGPKNFLVHLIDNAYFELLNLVLQFYIDNKALAKWDLHSGCGDYNLFLLALNRGAKPETIALMLHLNFPLPKKITSGKKGEINPESVILLYDHLNSANNVHIIDESTSKVKNN